MELSRSAAGSTRSGSPPGGRLRRIHRTEEPAMCLNCGCMRAHDDMGKPGTNITYEDVRRAADANDMTVDEALDTIRRTSDRD